MSVLYSTSYALAIKFHFAKQLGTRIPLVESSSSARAQVEGDENEDEGARAIKQFKKFNLCQKPD